MRLRLRLPAASLSHSDANFFDQGEVKKVTWSLLPLSGSYLLFNKGLCFLNSIEARLKPRWW